MSNAIKIKNNSVVFPAYTIDAEGLKKLIDESESSINDKNCTDPNADPDLKIAWWFLNKNTKIFDNGNVIVHFGDGRSQHTERDFQAFILYN